jgi:hypothetical protein
MHRFLATFLSLLTAVGFGWPGLVCACGPGESAAQVDERSSEHDCCPGESDGEPQREDSDDNCCDSPTCTMAAADGASELAVVERGQWRPGVDDVPAHVAAQQIPSAWTLDILSPTGDAPPLPSSHTSIAASGGADRYLILQVMRL